MFATLWDERRSPSVVPAEFLGSHAPLSAVSGMFLVMSRVWFGGWSSWPVNTAATAIAGSRPCFAGKAEESITNASNPSGVVKG